MLNKMNKSEVFIFGSKFKERNQDAISTLPVEMSWKIFLFLDDASLRNATKVNSIWRRLILLNKALRQRLNIFETELMLGSRSLVKYCDVRRRRLKVKRPKNYLPLGETIVRSTRHVFKCKRGGDDLIICSKRFKLH